MCKLRIIWLSNKVQSNTDRGTTGTWLDAMAHGLLQSGEVELGNIAMGAMSQTTRQDCGAIRQWIIPSRSQQRNGLLVARYISEIAHAVQEFSPDLVHVWGTESFWGLLTARGIIQYPALLEMQGLKGAIARVFAGGLSVRQQLACVGLKEILRRSTIFQGRRQFKDWGRVEREIIAGHRFITAQSMWLEAQIRAVNRDCQIFHNDFALREPFYAAESWRNPKNNVVFCSASYPSPFKGVHIAIRAIAILKERFPKIQLRIAGALQRHGIRQEGYVAWLNREARQLGVETNLRWLGPLTADQIVAELQQSSATLLPTFIEAYCLALAEAMIIGAPSVVSFVGGASLLARDEESALFFPPGDEAMCAYQLARLLTDRDLAERLSRKAREVALVRNDPQRIVENQLAIYRQVIGASGGKVES